MPEGILVISQALKVDLVSKSKPLLHPQLHSPSNVDLNNKKTTSPKGGKDWIPVSFSIQNKHNIKTMIKPMYHLIFCRKHQVNAVNLTGTQSFLPFGKVVLLFVSSTL